VKAFDWVVKNPENMEIVQQTLSLYKDRILSLPGMDFNLTSAVVLTPWEIDNQATKKYFPF